MHFLMNDTLRASGITASEFQAILARCRSLPPAQGNYLIHDYVENLLLTVLDFQMHTTAVERAARYFIKHRKETIRTHQDLKQLLDNHPNTKEGNLQLAQHLWGYNLWSRVELLRRLVAYFDANGVTTQDELKAWAAKTEFKDFQGKVKGMGFAIFKWLVMRQGVETIKPDLWIHRFVRDAIGRSVSDQTAVVVLEQAAKELDIKAYELDWRIWEYQRSQPRSTVTMMVAGST